ncbi:MAG: EAL domain-containing protein [Candidatus Gracilibacteria bacterium]
MSEKDKSLEIDKGNSVGIFVHIDISGCISKVCGDVEKIFGYTSSEVIGQHISILMDDRVGKVDILNSVEKLQQKNLLGFRKNQEEFPLELIIGPEENTYSKGYIGYIKDLTNEYIDAGTGLINHREFKKQLLSNLDSSENTNVYSLVVISFDNICKYIDIPEDKNIILKKYFNIVKKCIESFDIIKQDNVLYGSLQGDSFGIALFGVNIDKVTTISNKIRKILNSLNVGTETDPIHILSGIGIVEGNSKVDKVMDKGLDISLSALHKGGDRVEVFDEESDNDYQLEKNWRKTIEKALIGQDFHFELYCQKIVSSKGYDELNYEVLIRLFDEKTGKQISPTIFIPKAELLNLSSRIDNYVIDVAFKWLSDNPNHLSKLTKCSINLSGASISDKHKFEYIERLFGIYKIPPRKICFEVTETGEVKDKKTAKSLIKKLKGIGCEVAIDDFGRGNSSAEKLYAGYYDKVKIDGKFIKGLIDEKGKINELFKLLVGNVCQVSKLIGLKVVAEFVNGKETERVLREIGVDYFQGYESSGEPVPLTNYNDKKE